MARGGDDYTSVFVCFALFCHFGVMAALAVTGDALFCVGRRDYIPGLYIAGLSIMVVTAVLSAGGYALALKLSNEVSPDRSDGWIFWAMVLAIFIIILVPGLGCGVAYPMLPPS